MSIRSATYKDAPALKQLLGGLGFTSTLSLLINQLETLFGNDNNHVFVYEQYKEVIGFIAVHYLPQFAFSGELVLISCLSVDGTFRDADIARALEEYVTRQAMNRRCDQIQVKCHDLSIPKDQFYQQQGYRECCNFYIKKLVYNQ